VFSIGAALADAAARGADVRIITVFANDPGSGEEPAWWDRAAGYGSEGEAAQARRQEDAAACELLGVSPSWFPFRDASYERAEQDDDVIRKALEVAVDQADVVLVPGYPLTHPDHLRLARIALGSRRSWPARLSLYVEQPYAKWRARRRPWRVPQVPTQLGVEVRGGWTRLESSGRARRLKRSAALAYTSQLPLLSRGGSRALGRLLVYRVALYELLRGGEAVYWIDG